MKIYLLTHQRERDRPTNTGQIALKMLPSQVELILWDRVAPYQPLVDLINNQQVCLLYLDAPPLQSVCSIESNAKPVHSTDSRSYSSEPIKNTELETINEISGFIIIDATWQEARKIYNRSDYLKNAKKFSIIPEKESEYRLRRNQPVGSLCTIECIIELFTMTGDHEKAKRLLKSFMEFNQQLHN
jgi:DTW domain-containing protein YfiP